MKVAIFAAAMAVAGSAVFFMAERSAEACGCVHPPTPDGGEDIAINQSAEQIIFEVEEGFVTAHVLIQYAGKPDEFAWIVPVPSVPELSLSPETAFALLDRETAPNLSVSAKDECPVQEWSCEYAAMPYCESPNAGCSGLACSGGDADDEPSLTLDAGFGGAQDGGAVSTGDDPPVEVLERAVIGSYETVVFSAGDVDGTMQWLVDEGFIVNSTMAPFIQSYSDANMLFLASKLVAGANTSDIKPLRMRFASDAPMIPLKLTAVAAEPDMTITAYVYADQPYGPTSFDPAQIDASQLSVDTQGRMNYPMLLRRTVDEADGKNFVAEFSGRPAVVDFDQGTGCCSSDFDECQIAFDGICSCPNSPFDAEDCENAEEIMAGADLIAELAQKHAHLTRLTTRMSAEDMTYDPVFAPTTYAFVDNLSVANDLSTLGRCEADVIDASHYGEIQELRDCASLYCGTGTCVVTESGVGCECEEGTTARRFIDLDGQASTTCVPDSTPVDLSAGGVEVPDVCATIDCGNGSCLDVGGFPTCQCDAGSAGAQAGLEAAPVCETIVARSTSSGADNFSAPLADLPVCAPAPPVCGDYGWNVPADVGEGKRGFECAYSTPSAANLEPVEGPSCADLGLRERSSGCSTESTGGGLAGYGLTGLVFFLAFRRRRSAPGIAESIP